MNTMALDNSNSGSNIPGNKTNRDLSNTSSSYYALQVALQTMKERCQQLQQRLSLVEEENLRLRVERQKRETTNPDESKGELSVLKEHIAQLTRQKSQLTHHIYMVATENKQLWTRLSRLTEANHSLGSHLTKISDTLSRHSLSELAKPHESIHIVATCQKEADNGKSNEKERDTSLEEISLKIISSIIREKMELEQQCDQMSALQHNAVVSLEECGFGRGGVVGEEGGEEGGELGRVLENARDARDQLSRQQARLRATLATLTTITTGGITCKRCCEKDSGREQPQSQPPQQPQTPQQATDAPDEDRVCPLCGRVFERATQFDDFHAHVLTHFSDEDTTAHDHYDIIH